MVKAQTLENFLIWLYETLFNPKHAIHNYFLKAIGFADEVDITKFTYDCGGSLISQVKFSYEHLLIVFK